jgi:hypothetical protein
MAELAKQVSVVRLATLRKMRAVVRDALNSPAAEELLAGLPSLVLSCLREVHQAGKVPSSVAQPVQQPVRPAVNPTGIVPSVDLSAKRTLPLSPA